MPIVIENVLNDKLSLGSFLGRNFACSVDFRELSPGQSRNSTESDFGGKWPSAAIVQFSATRGFYSFHKVIFHHPF